MIYYKVVGHLEDREQGTGTFVFNDEQPLEYIERKFEKDQEIFKNIGKKLSEVKQ